MANKRLGDNTEIGAITGTDFIPIISGTDDYNVEVDDLATYYNIPTMNANISTNSNNIGALIIDINAIEASIGTTTLTTSSQIIKTAINEVDLKANSGVTKFGTCSTASATAEKAVTLSDFTLVTGATIEVTFTNANTAASPTLNVNNLGAKSIVSEDGTVTSATNPFYVPAGVTVEFTYNGTYFVYKNRIVSSYVNTTEWYEQWTNGKINQGGKIYIAQDSTATITFLKSFLNTYYQVFLEAQTQGGDAVNLNGTYATPTASTYATVYHYSTAKYYSWYACGY